MITPVSLAFWIQDDGAYVEKGGLTLCTDNFTLNDENTLKTVLETKFNLICTIQTKRFSNRDKTYYRIYISAKSLPLLKDLVLKFMHKQMHYKLHILHENVEDNPVNVDKTLANLKLRLERKGKTNAIKVEILDTVTNTRTNYNSHSEAAKA